MPTSILMYIIQNENEIPPQIVPNTAYYILSKKEVRIFDNMRVSSVFKMEEPLAGGQQVDSQLEERLTSCEKKIDKVFKYLTSFGGENEE